MNINGDVCLLRVTLLHYSLFSHALVLKLLDIAHIEVCIIVLLRLFVLYPSCICISSASETFSDACLNTFAQYDVLCALGFFWIINVRLIHLLV